MHAGALQVQIASTIEDTGGAVAAGNDAAVQMITDPGQGEIINTGIHTPEGRLFDHPVIDDNK